MPITHKETTITGFRCNICNIDFSLKEEYVKSIYHSREFNHPLELIKYTETITEVPQEPTQIKENDAGKDNSRYGSVDI